MTDWGSCTFGVAAIREARALSNAEYVQYTKQAVNGMPERRLLELRRDTHREAARKGGREGGREGVVTVCIIVGVNGKPICTNAVYHVVMSVHIPDVHIDQAHTWPSTHVLCNIRINILMITGSISQIFYCGIL